MACGVAFHTLVEVWALVLNYRRLDCACQFASTKEGHGNPRGVHGRCSRQAWNDLPPA